MFWMSGVKRGNRFRGICVWGFVGAFLSASVGELAERHCAAASGGGHKRAEIAGLLQGVDPEPTPTNRR